MQATGTGSQPLVGSVPGIYAIRCLANGKVYVGSSKNTQERTARHFRALRNRVHFSSHLQLAWNVYGADQFRAELLEHVAEESLLCVREQHWIDTLNACDPGRGYNARLEANSNRGWRMPDEGRQKISQALRGRPVSEETRNKLRVANTGRSHSAEERERISLAKKGKRRAPLSEAAKAKVSAARRGKPLSPEHRQKLSEAHRGITTSAASRLKQSIAHLGKPKSPETRARMSAAQIARQIALRISIGVPA